MKFKIFSKRLAQDEITVFNNCSEPHIWINIHDPSDTPAKLPFNPQRIAELRVAFDDCVEGETWNYWHGSPAILISEKNAEDIINFVDKHKNDVTMVCVNCFAGISRSSAVALVLSQWLNGHDSGIMTNERYHPNKTVINMLMRKLNKEQEASQ